MRSFGGADIFRQVSMAVPNYRDDCLKDSERSASVYSSTTTSQHRSVAPCRLSARRVSGTARRLTWVTRLVVTTNGWRREGHPRSPRSRLLRDPVLRSRDSVLGGEDERGDPPTGPGRDDAYLGPK